MKPRNLEEQTPKVKNDPRKLKGLSGHTFEELGDMLNSITKCRLPVEVFDAFLLAYRKTGDLNESRLYAQHEWDC